MACVAAEGAEPRGARSGCFRNAISSFIDCAGSEANEGMVALPFVIVLRVATAPNRLMAVSISGPRSPFSSGPWQTWQFCSYTARPISSVVGKPALLPLAAAMCGRDGINPPAFAVVDSPAGTSLTIEGISFERTYTVPFVGSAPVEKNNAPPFTLGRLIVSTPTAGGVYKPVLAFVRRSVHHTFSSGFMNPSYMSFTVIPWRPNGGTTVGKGCVFEVTSPGTSLCGTGRSSIGHRGFPVTLSNT